MTIRDAYDAAVVGAGPAGLAAATLCARAGLATVLFDEQPAAGGQIYRAAGTTPLRAGTILGDDYWRGRRLVADFAASGAQHVPGAAVWSLSREREIGVSLGGAARLVRAARVILATGAIERPFPIPGWTLPGVMTAGAAQILLKSAALVPAGRTVLAGSGPLLWLLARQYLEAGAEIAAILDTTPRANRRRALAHAPAFLASPYFAKGLALLRAVRRRVRVIGGVAALAAEGSGRLEAVRYAAARGEQRLPADLLLLHQGVVPNVNLAMAAGIAHRWDESQLCFVPERDAAGATALDGIAIAGDGGGIGGAEAAAEEGRLAAIAAIRALRPGADLGAEEIAARRSLARWRRGRRFLDALFRPAFVPPADETIVCRCEAVTAGEIAAAVDQGCTGPNQLKAFTRCGMGPCQGRLCGLTVTQLIAARRGVSPAEAGHYRLRPPVKPLTLGELAGLPAGNAAMKAVARD
ncbi:MAG: FAD-dependent oxidoreductase [Candidatus Odyssella sp.]|nr:FAD-dependent oxidoreductase [Candidatus Odyssella sp.]